MMSSYRRSDRKSLHRGLVAATLFVLVIFALDVLSGGGIRALARAGGSWVWSAGSQTASAIAGSRLAQSRQALLKENEELKEEVVRLTLRIAELGVLERENETLRAIAHVAESISGMTVPIVSSVRSSPYGTFMVGAGRGESVAVGDLVVASSGEGGGFVIGRVSEVSAHSSLVTQGFAPDVSTEAVAGDVPLVALGQGGGNARAQAPRAAPISLGEAVLSPSFRGLPIGVVGSVAQDPSSAYQTVYIGLPLNLTALTFVYVIPFSR